MKKIILFFSLLVLAVAGQVSAAPDGLSNVTPETDGYIIYNTPFSVKWMDSSASSGTLYNISVKDLTSGAFIGDIARGVSGFNHTWDSKTLSVAGIPMSGVIEGSRYQIVVCQEDTNICGYSAQFSIVSAIKIVNPNPIDSQVPRNVPISITWRDNGVDRVGQRYDVALINAVTGANLGLIGQGVGDTKLNWDVYHVGVNPTARFIIAPGVYRLSICREESATICSITNDFSVKDIPSLSISPKYGLVLGDRSLISWQDPFAGVNESYNLVVMKPQSGKIWSSGQIIASIRVATTSFSWRSGYHNSGVMSDGNISSTIPASAMAEGSYLLSVCRSSNKSACDSINIIIQRSPIRVYSGRNDLVMSDPHLLTWVDIDRTVLERARPAYTGGYNILIRKQGSDKQWSVKWDYRPDTPVTSFPDPISFNWKIGVLADSSQLPAGSGYFFTICQTNRRPCAYSEKFTVKPRTRTLAASRSHSQLASLRALLLRFR